MEAEDLFDAFYPLIDFGEDFDGGDMLRLEAEGRHRIYFINPAAIDFVAMPTHTFEEGRDAISAEAIDSLDECENPDPGETGDGSRAKQRTASKRIPTRRKIRTRR